MEEVGCTEAVVTAATGWAFKEGQCVTHKDQPLPSLVMMRVRSRRGAEIYGVRSFAFTDAQRDRIILGECLRNVVPGTEPCDACLLFNTGMCPGTAEATAT
jgi:hypothetical protein